MGNVINFPERKTLNATVIKLKRASDALDQVIISCLNDSDIDPKELAGLLAHRLGTLMKHMDNKQKLFAICQKVARKQADLDESAS
jgi:hypothetical protein